MDIKDFNVENEDARLKNVPGAMSFFSKYGFRLFAGTLLVYLICYLGQYIAVALFSQYNPGFFSKLASDYTYNLVFSLSIQYVLAMPVLALVLSAKLPAKTPEKRKVGFGWFVAFLIIAYSLMFTTNLLGTGINSAISSLYGKSISTYDVQDMIENANLWVVSVCTVFFAPVIEELIYRKIIIDRCSQYGEAASALVSGLAFGIAHGNFTQGLYAFVFGYFLAIIYNKTGKIYITIGIHMIVNFMGSFVPLSLMKIVDINAVNSLNFDDIDAAINYVQSNGFGLTLLALYEMLIVGFIVAGIVLLIVNRRRFMPKPGEIKLPKGMTFNVVMGNAGMYIFVIASILYIIYTFIRGLT